MGLLVLGLALPGLAADEQGGGPLTDVDFDASTVTIRDQVFKVTRDSELLDAFNEATTLLELEHQLGEWVFYKGIDRRPQPVLQVLQISPEDAALDE